MKARLARAVKSIDEGRRENLHKAVKVQWKKLCEKVRGHYIYYGITGNSRSLERFLHRIKRRWQRWLNRRNRENSIMWDVFLRLIERYPLPPPKIIHSIFRKGKAKQLSRRTKF
jgi:hypothetical protein